MSEITEFFQAVESGDMERVRRLLAARPELARARDAEGATALHHAAFNGHRPLVALLCDHGADLNARDHRHNATPAGWAIHYLRERGGLLAIEIDDLLHAIQTRDVLWARRFITRHPQLVEAKDPQGRPLASHARECGDPAIASLFGSSIEGPETGR
jgi:hypothetical protein